MKDGSEKDPGTEGSGIKDVSLLLSSFSGFILRQVLLVEWTSGSSRLTSYRLHSVSRTK